jgi:dUTP pyrophosphatase
MKIKIVNLSEFDLPKYETHGSAGMDLRADLKRYGAEYDKIDEDWFLTLEPHNQYTIPTGIFIALPKPIIESYSGEGYGIEAEIRPRSGLASKKGISIANTPGTIDSDFRGEIKIILVNLTDIPYRIKHGDRIAQMVINRYEIISWDEVDNLDKTERDDGGFGSTGK